MPLRVWITQNISLSLLQSFAYGSAAGGRSIPPPNKGEVDSICFVSKQMLSGGGPASTLAFRDHPQPRAHPHPAPPDQVGGDLPLSGEVLRRLMRRCVAQVPSSPCRCRQLGLLTQVRSREARVGVLDLRA